MWVIISGVFSSDDIPNYNRSEVETLLVGRLMVEG